MGSYGAGARPQIMTPGPFWLSTGLIITVINNTHNFPSLFSKIIQDYHLI